MIKRKSKIISFIALVALLSVLLFGCTFTSVDDHYSVQLEGDFEVSFLISCEKVLTTEGAFEGLPNTLKPLIPKDGYFIPKVDVLCVEGDSVTDLLRKICANKNISLTITGGNYIASIGGLSEKMYANNLGGWMYKVNGVFPNKSASMYTLVEGDIVEWLYTCEPGDLGELEW